MHKILIIDDDIFYLEIIKNILESLHFDTHTSDNITVAKSILKENTFDIIVTDLHFGKETSEELIAYIREDLKLKVPVLVLTGSQSHKMMESLLELGATDYIQKPISTKNLSLKIFKHLHLDLSENVKNLDNKMINEKRIGIVIPCYNEEKRLESEEYKKFIRANSSYQLCFVNDGSTDHTLDALYHIQKYDMYKISILDLVHNEGKAEAVRKGIKYLMIDKQLDYIGFLDADLSTNFEDFNALSKLIQTEEYDMIVGSRIKRAGATINKESKRNIISFLINRIIVSIIKIDIKDTQCGAKIFKLEVAQQLFKNKFESRWLFDVELFIRLKTWKKSLHQNHSILEYPLKRWIHKEGSKLGFKDSFEIFLELNRIRKHYQKRSNQLAFEGHIKQTMPTSARLHNYHRPTEVS